MRRLLPRAVAGGRRSHLVVFGAGILGGAVPWLLRRMRDGLIDHGRLSRPTAAIMWTGYGLYFLNLAAALGRRAPVGSRPVSVRTVAAALLVTGSAVTASAQRQFTGSGELTGTKQQHLVTGGVYRYCRHPQYAGLITLLSGAALLRRSVAAWFMIAMLAVVFRIWVPIEEQHLRREFGAGYLRYTASTQSRWRRGGH